MNTFNVRYITAEGVLKQDVTRATGATNAVLYTLRANPGSIVLDIVR